MYLLPFETEVRGQQDIIALGNVLPQQEFFEIHKLALTTDNTVIIEVLACVGPVLGQDITGQVASSNASQKIFSGLFKVILNPKFGNPFRLKVYEIKPGQPTEVIDQRDGIVLAKNVYLVVRVNGNAKITGNLLWMQPEGRRGV